MPPDLGVQTGRKVVQPTQEADPAECTVEIIVRGRRRPIRRFSAMVVSKR